MLKEEVFNEEIKMAEKFRYLSYQLTLLTLKF